MSRLTQKCIASPVQQRIQAKYIDRTIFKESKTDAARQVNFKMIDSYEKMQFGLFLEWI